MASTSCADCGNQVNGLREIGEYAGLTASTITDVDGNRRPCLAPTFKNIREVCYPCYKAAVRREVEASKR